MSPFQSSNTKRELHHNGPFAITSSTKCNKLFMFNSKYLGAGEKIKGHCHACYLLQVNQMEVKKKKKSQFLTCLSLKHHSNIHGLQPRAVIEDLQHHISCANPENNIIKKKLVVRSFNICATLKLQQFNNLHYLDHCISW